MKTKINTGRLSIALVVALFLASIAAPALAYKPNEANEATLVNETVINANGVDYKKETYEIKVGNGEHDKIEYVLVYKAGEKPNIIVDHIPGNNINGWESYAHNFPNSIVKKLIDGEIDEIENEYGISDKILSQLKDKKIGVAVFNKVRAAYVPAGLSDYSFMAYWGIETYVDDLEKIVEHTSEITGVKNHVVIGHSRGGEIAQGYADRKPKNLKGLIVLDAIGEYDPQSIEYQNAIKTLNALEDYTAKGNYASDMSGLLKVLWAAENYPNYPSPVPGFAGMTNMQVALWMLENTGKLPGPLTPETGLPDNWYITNYCAGNLAGLYHTDINTLFEIMDAGGLYPIRPLALDRQGFEKRTHGGINQGYKVNFEEWKNDIFHVSVIAENGFHEDSYTESLLEKLNKTEFVVLDGLGHLDILLKEE